MTDQDDRSVSFGGRADSMADTMALLWGTKPPPSRGRKPGMTVEGIVAAAIESDPDAAERVREGNMKAIGPLVGYVMRETKGRADGGEVNRLIQEKL